MKIAENYGFSPNNDGLTNSECLQKAIDNGGDIYISTPGVYSVSEQIYLGDDTSIYFCAGAYLKREKHPEENGLELVVSIVTGWMSGRLFLPPCYTVKIL